MCLYVCETHLNFQMFQKSAKGFTLIELLVVIAILAVLATAATLILNPAELIRQGRDSTRLSDLDTLNTALSLYLADVDPTTADLGACSVTNANCTKGGAATSTFLGRTVCTEKTGTGVNGDAANWVDVNFGLISGGSPLSKLPVDPVNSTSYYYGYACDDDSDWYEFNAMMESKKYSNAGGAGDVESDDGGDNSGAYEVGNDPGLNL